MIIPGTDVAKSRNFPKDSSCHIAFAITASLSTRNVSFAGDVSNFTI